MSALISHHADTSVRRLAQALGRDGYLILRGLVRVSEVASLHDDLRERFEKTPFCKGAFYGERTKRFGGLLRRSPRVGAFILNPTILALADVMLGPHCDRFQLNLTQALEIYPGQDAQAPHRDQAMWRAPAGAAEYLINIMWPFSDYTRKNGATIIYPGSHRTPIDQPVDEGDGLPAEMAPGDALVFLGSTLHGGGANVSSSVRCGMITSYSLGWLKPYENQLLIYPPEVARTFPPELATLVGYFEHRPSLGNYEGQCPSILLRDPAPDYLAATDHLLPEQVARLEARRLQRSSRTASELSHV